ncbi:hypothetical protein [Bdellovibrio sp. ZAP7]|uniref:hypothetical protein n=1 Tax=Bdellovibrio sp. ZAP7 TaxID=2231053 RepID=UPI00115A0919|nr:hypothetical protein [Bdellovibrio sp. ZAP7]
MARFIAEQVRACDCEGSPSKHTFSAASMAAEKRPDNASNSRSPEQRTSAFTVITYRFCETRKK